MKARGQADRAVAANALEATVVLRQEPSQVHHLDFLPTKLFSFSRILSQYADDLIVVAYTVLDIHFLCYEDYLVNGTNVKKSFLQSNM